MTLSLPLVMAGVIVVALNAYAVMGGADYGGGVWDWLATGPRRREQRELIASAIAPIWEANHVWLILAVVLLFTCFPPAFATLSIVLHVPLSLLLIGIVARGSAFTFRAYDSTRSAVRARWGRIFAAASVVTPLLLGITVGAIASGRVGAVRDVVEPTARCGENVAAAAYRACAHTLLAESGGYVGVFIAPWLTPFAIATGVLAVALFAFLAAVYLTLEADDDALREDFRGRALVSAAVVFLAALAALLLALEWAPDIGAGLLRSRAALPLHVLTAIAAVTAIVALWMRRYALARIAAVLQVSLILWGWAVAQLPYLIPPRLTIADAAAPRSTLVLIGIALVAGAAILVPSLIYLFRIFKGGVPAER